MYDIEFFEQVEPLKRQIMSGSHSPGNAAKILDRFEWLRDRQPWLFNLETTNYCNMRCVMCPRTTLMSRKNQWMDHNLFKTIISQTKPQKDESLKKFWSFVMEQYGETPDSRSENQFYFYTVAQHLTLHGYGEPLLDPNLRDRIITCKNNHIPTYFSCTPINIKMDLVHDLMEQGLGVLKFSFDALDDAMAKTIRGKNNDFSHSLENIQSIAELKSKKGYKTRLVVSMIALSGDPDAEQIRREFIDMWKENDVQCYIKNQDNRWYHDEDEECRSKAHYADQYCEFAWTSLSVMANGRVVPCTQDYDAEIFLGDANKQSLAEVWNGLKYEQFRHWHATGTFPKGHKCVDRCDIRKLYQVLECHR